MFESLFELLFKYRPLVFRQGDFMMSAPWPMIGIAVAVAGAVAVTVLTYAQVRGKSQQLDRGVLAAIRLMALGVLLFCLFRPVLVLSSVVPQQNFLGVLIDDSRSMEIADRDGEPRAAFVTRNFVGPDSALLDALQDRFALRFFRFSLEHGTARRRHRPVVRGHPDGSRSGARPRA